MGKETFEANKNLVSDFFKIQYMRYLEGRRKSTMESIVNTTQRYADEPHTGTHAWEYNEYLPRANKELREIETELDHLSKAEEEGYGFTVDLSKITFWEVEE